MNHIFHHLEKIQLYHVDAAGLIFYGQLFSITHNTFSAFLEHHQISIRERLEKKDYFFPVVHVDANYLKPIRLEDVLKIEMTVEGIKESSFSVRYQLFNHDLLMATVLIVHVAIDAKSHTKQDIPSPLRSVLEKYLKKGV